MSKLPFWLGGDIVADIKARLPWYADDWREGGRYGISILSPSLFIFFASVLPALAFGEQLAGETEGTLTVVHVLVSTALAGVTQALVGGQPLLVLGVAEPIVIIYAFMYQFAKERADLGPRLFLPWAAWVCVWTSIMCVGVAVTGACRFISRFTRMCGELFGLLIAVLFMQQAIKGLISEFRAAPDFKRASISPTADEATWLLVNGLWALLLATGALVCCLGVGSARHWRYGTRLLRAFLSDYGVPLCVVAWSALSFAISSSAGVPGPEVPRGVPRRISTPHTWQVHDTWRVTRDMGDVPAWAIGGALIPAAVITTLFWFDHGVSAQLAQQPEFNLTKPPSYAWDQLLLAALTLACGLLGLPPVNGVIPQSPMHTRALAALRMQWEEDVRTRQSDRQQRRSDREQHQSDRERHQSDREQSQSHREQIKSDREQSQSDIKAGESDPIHMGGQDSKQAVGHATGVTRHQSSHPPLFQSFSQSQSSPNGRAKALELSLVPGPGTEQMASDSGRRASGQMNGAVRSATTVHTTSPSATNGQQLITGKHSNGVRGIGGSATENNGESAEQRAEEEVGRGLGQVPPAGTSAGAVVGAGAGTPAAAAGAGAGAGAPAVAATLPQTQGQPPAGYKKGQSQKLGEQTTQGTQQAKKIQNQNQNQNQSQKLKLKLNQNQKRSEQHGAPTLGVSPDGEVVVVAHPVAVAEQRVSNLVQALLCGACLGATHAVRQVPTAVVWAYFAFMALSSLPGNQFWERLLLLLTDPHRRPMVLQHVHAPYLETVPFRVTAAFTAFQFLYLAGVWALITWAGIAGVSFPVAIVALIPVRAYILPRLMASRDLQELDADEFTLVAGLDPEDAAEEAAREVGLLTAAEAGLNLQAPTAPNGHTNSRMSDSDHALARSSPVHQPRGLFPSSSLRKIDVGEEVEEVVVGLRGRGQVVHVVTHEQLLAAAAASGTGSTAGRGTDST